MTDTISTNRR